MPCSLSLASPARMILMRLIFVTDHPPCRRRRSTARLSRGRTRRERPAMRMALAAGRARPPVTLDPDQSAALREKLLTEVGNITSADLAAAWAREALTAKNSLIAADAKLV